MKLKWCYVIFEVEDWGDGESRGEWFTVVEQFAGVKMAQEFIETNKEVALCREARKPVIGPLVASD